MVCVHCHRKRATRPGGLCWGCYYRPGVRALYPTTSKYAPGKEPTEAEVEATVEQQRKCLPPWWDRESKRLAELERGGFIPSAGFGD